MKPLVFDLFCGLAAVPAFIADGYRAVGFDIEAHDYGGGGYPGELILRDIRLLKGAALVKEFGVAAVIVASPPCQEFSYMDMPWSKAKEKQRNILADPAEQTRLTDLFNQCFRIQREVSEAAGHYVPMVVENVRGAQKWVGKARGHFGSFYLWGDVPVPMPIPERIAGLLAEGSKGVSHRSAGHWTNPAEHGARNGNSRVAGLQAEGTKIPGIGGLRENGKGDAWFQNGAAGMGSKSSARKRASAEIAKIPPRLAGWIAKSFKPQDEKLSKQPIRLIKP